MASIALIRGVSVRFIQATSSRTTMQVQVQVRGLQLSATRPGSHILAHSPNAKLDPSIADKYKSLPLPECLSQVEYVWIDGTREKTRSKARTLNFVPNSHTEAPQWTYDGSSTFQAQSSANSDTTLNPVAIYYDPFRRGNSRIVLCDTYDPEGKPTASNNRAACFERMNKILDEEPMFGIEQEYFFMDVDGRPFGWPAMHGEPAPAGPYYCGVGAKQAYGRAIVEAHYRACLFAGIDLEGINAEVVPSQWEYQVGVCKGIKCADDVWMARYILDRIAEEFGVDTNLDCKPFPNWNGSGMHTNFSSKKMREENGIVHIEAAIEKLSKRHAEHMRVYDMRSGEDNKLRMTGKFETSDHSKFSSGVGNRSVSVRIGRAVAQKKKGHLEDRRPASNADPYQVCNEIVRSIYEC